MKPYYEEAGIGIEIKEKYCEIAANRLRQEMLPLAAPPATDAALVDGLFPVDS